MPAFILGLCGFLTLALWETLPAAETQEPKPDEVPKAIFKFMERPEPAYRWELKETKSAKAGKIHHLHLVSQTWHEIIWEHALFVYEPPQIAHPEHMLLFVTGGSTGKLPSDKDQEFGLQLAHACGAAVAMLYQVPNQPILDNRKEDDLITETWLRYLKTGDETWPLLFPMVKSAVKAMDALQAFSKEHLPKPVRSFVITGASKRGWTSWLTPVVDPRVVGTAPIVIDVLNFLAQTKHQKDTWGKYSEQIIDYTSKGLVKTSAEEESPRERQLRLMMDPYTYRKRLTLPKLMIVGTNDRYWVVDAMNLYWDDLSGPKYVLQVPNAGHDLGEGRNHALNTLSVFFRHVAAGKALPTLKWTADPTEGKLTLQLQSDPMPARVKLWKAEAMGKDFREAKWTSEPLAIKNPHTQAALLLPGERRHIAVFGEMEFEYGGRTYSLSTLVYRR